MVGGLAPTFAFWGFSPLEVCALIPAVTQNMVFEKVQKQFGGQSQGFEHTTNYMESHQGHYCNDIA